MAICDIKFLWRVCRRFVEVKFTRIILLLSHQYGVRIAVFELYNFIHRSWLIYRSVKKTAAIWMTGKIKHKCRRLFAAYLDVDISSFDFTWAIYSCTYLLRKIAYNRTDNNNNLAKIQTWQIVYWRCSVRFLFAKLPHASDCSVSRARRPRRLRAAASCPWPSRAGCAEPRRPPATTSTTTGPTEPQQHRATPHARLTLKTKHCPFFKFISSQITHKVRIVSFQPVTSETNFAPQNSGPLRNNYAFSYLISIRDRLILVKMRSTRVPLRETN